MEVVQKLVPLMISISLAGLVLAVGMNTTKGDLLYVWRRPILLLKGVTAVMIIPPIIAGILVAIMPLEPVVKAGLMLMAISPVPPLVPGREMSVGARKEYAYGLYFALAVLTIISAPLVMAIATRIAGRHDTISIASVTTTVLLGVILPLAIGVTINRLAPAFAARTWALVNKIALLLVVLAFLPILVKVWPQMMALIGNGTLVGIVIAAALMMLGGHLLGGPELVDRGTLAMAAVVRHPGIAMSAASTSFFDHRVSAAVLLVMLVGMVAAIPYTMWIKKRSKAEAASAGSASA